MDTPRPLLPLCGLTTTGSPISSAASQASSALVTIRPAGTGTPTEVSNWRVSCLSWALRFTVTELHQVAVGQTQRGDSALLRAVHDALRARAVAVVVGELAQRAQR